MASTEKKRLWREPSANVHILPIIEEEIKVGKRTVESGRVVIHKIVEERQQIIDEPLLQEEVLIKRVPINRPVERRLPVRREGDVMIILVMQEVLVVGKRLILKEELHVRRTQKQTRRPQRITLHGERAEIKRMPPTAQQ